MTYTKTTWVNGGPPGISAELLNKIEQGIKDAHDAVAGKVTKSGDTMTGPLVAQANTQYTTRQMRNVIISTAAPETATGQNGDIWIRYE